MGQEQSRHQRTRQRREERAVRVLDVTKELVLKWGYSKTTLDDIARHADIGKGTLFLHWPNRDALFVSLLRGERVQMLAEIRDALARSPEQASLYEFVRHYVRAYSGRPVLTALLIGDQATLGRLADRKRAGGSSTEMRQGLAAYLEALRDHGLVRDDVPTTDLVYSFAATFYGFVALPLLAPEGMAPSRESGDTLWADSVYRVLAPPTVLTAEQQKRAGEITLQHLDQMFETAREKYRDSLDTPSGADR